MGIKELNDIMAGITGLDGAKLHMLTGMVTALLLEAVMPFIGYVMNKIEGLEIKLVTKYKGRVWAALFCSWLTFPGVVIHELSHALVAIFTGARIIGMALFKPSNDGTLGYVNVMTKGKRSKQRIQMAAVSSAPVFMGILTISILHKLVTGFQLSILARLFFVYLAVCVMNHMSMSKADLKMYRKGCFYLLVPMSVVMFLVTYFIS